MFTSYLTQFHTGFAVLVTGNKTPTFSFALQYLTPPLEIGIQGRQVLPKFIQRTPEKRIGHEQVLLHVGLFDTVTGFTRQNHQLTDDIFSAQIHTGIGLAISFFLG